MDKITQSHTHTHDNIHVDFEFCAICRLQFAINGVLTRLHSEKRLLNSKIRKGIELLQYVMIADDS